MSLADDPGRDGPPAVEAALSLEGLRVELASGKPVIDEVSLQLGLGETLAIVGESGSGKTTTALALLGYARRGLTIAGGKLTIGGTPMPLGDEPAARRLRGRIVSHVPQEPAASLNPSMRIGDAVADILRAHLPEAPREESIAEALARVNLPSTTDFLRRFPHQLSGGQQQRVMIAMALACKARLIVLDEPTTGLDVVTQAHVLDQIKQLHDEEQLSMVYVSHDLAVVAQIADRIAVMYGGRVIEQGPADEVLQHSRHPYTRGLIGAVPDHLVARRLQGIPGVAVGVNDRPQGCSFAPRCPLRVARCTEQAPPVESVAIDHTVRCFQWRDASSVAISREARELLAGQQDSALLEVSGLEAVHVGQHGTVVAAKDISFSLAARECVGLVGESGSGKTTIARCVVGLHRPSGGSIKLDGEPLAPTARDRGREQRRRCQFIFQNPYESLNPSRRVGEQISHAAQVLRRLDAKAAREETARILELVRLPGRLAERFPRELSGGERQRVAIARAAVAQPDVLVCDEITSALDVSIQGAVLELLGDLRGEFGMSILFITHDLGVVASIADRVLVLDRGEICEQGTVTQVFGSPTHPRARELLEAAPRLASVG